MSDSSQAPTSKLIAELWQRSQPLIEQRLAQLDAAATAAHAGLLHEPQRAEAESTAHKLSGSLGMFGFPDATDLARELEAELRTPAPSPARLTALAQSLRAALHPA